MSIPFPQYGLRFTDYRLRFSDVQRQLGQQRNPKEDQRPLDVPGRRRHRGGVDVLRKRCEPGSQSMKIGLLHNPGAGHGKRTIAELTMLLKEAGHQVSSASTKGKRWKELLAEPIERIIISGGDGTVSKVVPLLVGKNLPFHILPLGTANNIARCLDQIQS